MNFAVLQFPGSNCDQDAVHVLRNVLGHSARLLWHKERSLGDAQAVIVPGGFSFGDYLRTGAIARFSPVMQAVQTFAANGGLVLGICNGFQILCEAGLLPGALLRNRSLQFRCEPIFLKTATRNSPFTNKVPEDKLLRLPIAHGEGCFFADPDTLAQLKASDQVLWHYVNAQGEPAPASNPNGSLESIAGICNQARNVAGLMPHPERASEPILGSADGRLVFESMIAALEREGQGSRVEGRGDTEGPPDPFLRAPSLPPKGGVPVGCGTPPSGGSEESLPAPTQSGHPSTLDTRPSPLDTRRSDSV